MKRTLRTRKESNRYTKLAGNRRLFLEQLEDRELMAADSAEYVVPTIPKPAGLGTIPVELDLETQLMVAASRSTLKGPAQLLPEISYYRSPRIAATLAQMGYDFDRLRGSGNTDAFKPGFIHADIENDYVFIEALAADTGPALTKQLTAIGSVVSATAGSHVSGWVPLNRIRELAALPGVRYAEASLFLPVTQSGEVTSQGDLSILTDKLRDVFNGVTGAGVKIGVISDSFNTTIGNSRTTWASEILAGDLPGVGNPEGHTTPVNKAFDVTGKNEGRAMAQIIHDIAPDAEIIFYSGSAGGQTGIATAINQLRTTYACNIIVDDLLHPDEPMFQDGAVAQEVEAAVAAGVTYVSSAGNNGVESYEVNAFSASGSYTYSHPFFGTGSRPRHDFGSGDTTQTINVPVDNQLTISVQWDDPNVSVGGIGATRDFDVFVMETGTTNVIASSVNYNVGGNARETIQFTNPGPATSYDLIITQAAGPPTGRLKTVVFGGAAIGEHRTDSPTMFGHANAANAIAVGATYYPYKAEGGATPVIDTFSSVGGVPILFNTSGSPVTAQYRYPAITGPNGANTSFFPIPKVGKPLLDYEGDGFPNFDGTSAAAPHIAALLGLLKQINPSLTPAQLRTALTSTARSMANTAASGAGLANGREAAFSVYTPAKPDLAAGSDNGIASNDDITSASTLLLVGTVPENSYVTLYDGASAIASQQLTGGDTTYDFSISNPGWALNKSYRVTVKSSSTSTAVSAQSPALTIKLDPMLTYTPTVIPDLEAASDLGLSSTDNITADSTPTFSGNVDAIAAGATRVWLYVDGVVKGFSILSPGSTAYNMTSTSLADGAHSVTMKIQLNNSIPVNHYPSTSPLSMFTDIAAPVATITPVTPDPRNATVSSIGISFDRAVSGFEAWDLALVLNGGANRLGFAVSSENLANPSGDNRNFVLQRLDNLTMAVGTYTLTFNAASAGVFGRGGSIVATTNATDTWAQGNGTYQNPLRYMDVNNDGWVTTLDANLISNAVNIYGAQVLPGTYPSPYSGYKLDVNSDGIANADDFYTVTAFLNLGYSLGPY